MSDKQIISIIENNIENIDQFKKNIETIFKKNITSICSGKTFYYLKSKENISEKKVFLNVDISKLNEEDQIEIKKYSFKNNIDIDKLIENYNMNIYVEINVYLGFDKIIILDNYLYVDKDNILSFLSLKGNRNLMRFHAYQLAKLFKSKKAIYICDENRHLLGNNIDESFAILNKLGFKQYPINQFWEEYYAEGYDEARDKGYFVDTFDENFENEFLNYTLEDNDIVFDENGIGFS